MGLKLQIILTQIKVHRIFFPLCLFEKLNTYFLILWNSYKIVYLQTYFMNCGEFKSFLHRGTVTVVPADTSVWWKLQKLHITFFMSISHLRHIEMPHYILSITVEVN